MELGGYAGLAELGGYTALEELEDYNGLAGDWRTPRALYRPKAPINYAVSHPGNINPAARNVATNIDGTLDRAAVQKNAICSFQAITAASI